MVTARRFITIDRGLQGIEYGGAQGALCIFIKLATPDNFEIDFEHVIMQEEGCRPHCRDSDLAISDLAKDCRSISPSSNGASPEWLAATVGKTLNSD